MINLFIILTRAFFSISFNNIYKTTLFLNTSSKILNDSTDQQKQLRINHISLISNALPILKTILFQISCNVRLRIIKYEEKRS